MRTTPLVLLVIAVACGASAADVAADAAADAWRLTPLQAQLTRSERLAGADNTDNAARAQLAITFALRGPEGQAWLRAVAAFDEPLTDRNERVAILDQWPKAEQPMLAAQSQRSTHGARGVVGQGAVLTIEPPPPTARSVRVTGTLDLIVGDGEATQGLLRGADPMAMDGVPAEQAPRISGNENRNVRLAIGEDAIARIAAIDFLDAAGKETQSWVQQWKGGQLACFAANWPADGAIRITWYARTRTLKVPFALDIPVPGAGAEAVDETIPAEPVP